jgi:hypothetical protein
MENNEVSPQLCQGFNYLSFFSSLKLTATIAPETSGKEKNHDVTHTVKINNNYFQNAI